MVQDGGLLRDPHARVLRRQRRRLRRLPRPDREARLPAVARRRLHLAAAVLPVAAARRRLRHRRLLPDPPRLRDRRRRARLHRRGARARHPRDRRPRHEPHVLRPPVVSGGALEPGQPQARLVRVVGHRCRYDEARIIFTDTETSNWTWDEKAGAYYWHRFFSHQPDLNYDNPEVREAMLDVLRFWLDLGLDGFRLDAVPYLYERDGTNCENLPETHAFLKRVRAEVDGQVPRPGAAGRGQPVAGGRRRVLRRRRRVPHGVPLPGHAADVHGRAARGGHADLRDPAPDAAHPGQLPVGPVPAQPRRADARDGDRRGTRLHVLGVRQGPADEDQRRHPPPARAADGRRPRRDRAAARDPLQPAGLAGPLLRRRDRDGRQRLPRRPRRRAHADAVDGRPQRRLQPRGLRAALRAAADGPGLRLPGRQRRGPAAHAVLAAALAAPLHRAAQGAPRVRPRHVRGADALQPARSSPASAPTRTTSCCACTTSRARRRRSSST